MFAEMIKVTDNDRLLSTSFFRCTLKTILFTQH